MSSMDSVTTLETGKTDSLVESTTRKLLGYCAESRWAGYDPYDVLNSRLFRTIPLLDSRIPRIAFTQAFKRVPFNLRPILGIEKTQNPKALAVFLKAFLNLKKCGFLQDPQLITYMIDRLDELRSKVGKDYCWGYSFPWQTRTVLVPKGVPNLVCTVFVADSLLGAYEQDGREQCLKMAVSAADYILDELYWENGESGAGFSYPVPGMKTKVHNANLLASAFLCRAFRNTGGKRYLEAALASCRYAVSRQNQDGSWFYGELPTQKWIDNFHTGYNLGALRSIALSLPQPDLEQRIRKGFRFYRDHFFREDGYVSYFHDKKFPVDAHCVAQSIITLMEFKDLDAANVDLAREIFSWAMSNIWDEKKGYFYYRVYPFWTDRTSYMRWTQAWMLLAMSTLHEVQGQISEPSAF